MAYSNGTPIARPEARVLHSSNACYSTCQKPQWHALGSIGAERSTQVPAEPVFSKTRGIVALAPVHTSTTRFHAVSSIPPDCVHVSSPDGDSSHGLAPKGPQQAVAEEPGRVGKRAAALSKSPKARKRKAPKRKAPATKVSSPRTVVKRSRARTARAARRPQQQVRTRPAASKARGRK